MPRTKNGISYQQIIINVLALKAGDWVPSHQLEKADTKWGWLGTSGTRRARELAELDNNGKPIHVVYLSNDPFVIESKDFNGYAHYRLIPMRREPEQQRIFI